MTNITQQDTIEDAAKYNRVGFETWYKGLYPRILSESEFQLAIDVWKAARSDDRQSGELVAVKISRGSDGRLLLTTPDGRYFDVNEYIGQTFYLAAPLQAIPAETAPLNNMTNSPEHVKEYIRRQMPDISKELVALMTSPKIDEIVSRFLSWKLPKDFSPDAGINFNKLPHLHDSHEWPIGTNLLTADMAKAMFRYVLAGAHVELSAAPSAPETTQTDAVISAARKTLEENGHLADGDVCTLFELREALAAYDAKATPDNLKEDEKMIEQKPVAFINVDRLQKHGIAYAFIPEINSEAPSRVALFTADQLKAEREKAIREIAELFTFNTKARILDLLSANESKEPSKSQLFRIKVQKGESVD